MRVGEEERVRTTEVVRWQIASKQRFDQMKLLDSVSISISSKARSFLSARFRLKTIVYGGHTIKNIRRLQTDESHQQRSTLTISISFVYPTDYELN